MKNTSLFRRILSVVLVVAMVLSVMVPMASAESAKKVTSQSKELDLTPIDPGTLESQKQGVPADASNENQAHKANDVVRVSIVLEKASTLEAGYKAESYTKNAAARAYRESLRQDQKAMTVKIEEVVGKLEVKWNLTLAANIISANVRFGDIEAIKAIDGVKDVFLENRYEPQVDEKADEPNNGSASYMIGSNITWANGYTGAGSKVAVIDTGADTLHQSFSGEGLEYALAQTAEEKGMSYDEYVASLNLLTADKIEALKGELNANIGSGAAAYRNTKIGFGYNYVDKNVSYIDHDQDTQGEHGSHVSGIATGNRFIKVGEGYQPALSAVGTQGVAPDAQLVVMKVFGKGGGAYDSDYMVAIEDAIVLGCDSANLSLGSGSPGFSFSNGYESVMNKLVENGTVVAFSAGNSGMWYDTPNNPVMQYPYLHIDDVNYQTNGSPGSFTNSLSTASVDNMGQTGMPLIFGDRHVFYSQTSGYGNDPISTIAGQEYEYVLVDGPGVDDNDHVGGEGDQFAALGSEVLSGKVAMCYRGSSSFFAKANAAVAQGAVAVVIINNQAGVINMNLTGYNYTAPAVSILKADGDAIKADSEAVTDEAGNVLYYKGSMSVAAEIEVQVPEVTDTVSVSSFSSYGVPGTMVLKPEILTPGGSIYSVNGYNQLPSSQGGGYSGGHDQYEVMSGTSMASPQTAGMAAVMGQYIRDNGLCEKTGLSQRQLINSLLMSTAHPVFDEYGDYWPTFRVGAGLGNIADATAAKSYILMDENATLFPDTAKDGKVKVELGDDPDYTGEYSYSFTLYPLEDSKEFTLRTDIFTQGVAGNGGYGVLQDTGTMLIGSVATYEVNGETYEDVYELEADVNMDGETNEADAQAILDHLTGEEAEDAKFDAEAADVDGDNAITTLDAKLILDSAATPTITITEPTKVTVNIKIDEEWKALLLNYYFTKGFFVEGYTYVEPVADEEGALDVVHSIPIFGFCGSWTGPAMLDRSSAIDEAYGTGKATYITNAKNSQYLSIKDPDGAASIYMGNPYMIEDEFPVERLAMNSEATITAFNYLNIRNAATLGFAVQDEEGNVLYAQATPTQKFSAYYYVNGSSWQNTSPTNYNVGKKLSQAGVKEGDVVTVGFYALPEYYGVLYAKNNGEVAESGGLDTEGFKAILESGVVGDGAAIKYTVKIDDQAPEVKGALLDLITGDITIRAQDDNYIAYVAVTNKSGSKVYMEGVPAQEGPGELVELPLELPEGEALPNEAVLLVGDYAGNEVAFKVNLGGSGSDEQESIMLGFVGEGTTAAPGSGNRAWEIEPDALWYNHSTGAYAGLSNYANLPFTVTAAEYVDGYVFMAADDGWLYAAPLDALDEPVRVGEYVYLTEKIYDLAFNYKNNTLYALGTDNSIYYVDLLYGVQYKVAEVTLPDTSYEMNRLACDDNGVFYTANYGSGSSTKLYKFTLEGGAPIEPEDPEEPIEGETAYAWGFETGLDGWTAIDADGDGYNWTWNQNISSWYSSTPDFNSMAHTGTGAVLSGSYINTVGVLTPDNWFVSPAFDLSEADAATVAFWLNSIDSSYPEQVTVYAGTSADPAGMVAISDAITTPSEYTQYSASLADFVGEEEVHVAIRNNGTTDMFLVVLDDVEIILPDEGEAAPAAVKAVPAVVRGEAVTKPHEVRDADDIIVSYSFESESELNGWTFDNDESEWILSGNNLGGYDYSPYAYDGSAFLMSYSFVDYVGASQADNWAITPPVTLAEEGAPYVTFVATNANASYPEPFSVFVGTSADPDEMELLQANISPSTGAGDGWTEYSFDLSDYVGETIYLAFHDYNYDAYEIWIDLLQFHGDGGADQPDPEPDPEPEPEPVEVVAVTAEVVGSGLGVYNYSNAGSMAWDHDNDILYLVSNWNTTQDYDHYLWVVDTETGVAARANETQGTALSSSNPSARLYGAVRGLVIVPGKSHLIQPTDVVEGLEVEPAELNIFKGQTAPIAATAFPWTLTEKGVTFESADPSIATVNAEGIVTGVEVGSTTVTVTTVALDLEGEPLSLDVDVNVSVPPEAHLRGIIWDENGKGQASEFDSNAPEEWTALAVVGQLRWGALVGDTVYGSTEDTMYAFDADTYEVTQLGGIVSMWIPSDACELPQDFREAFAAMGYNVGPVIGPNNNGTYLTMLDPEAGSLIYFDLSDNVFGSDPLATFTYAGRDEYDDGESVDTNGALFYGATESGELYAFVMNHEGSIMWTDMGNIGIDLTGVADATNSIWASMVYDAETSFLFLSLYNGTDDYAHLYAIDTNDLSRVGETGTFNADVWPVTGLYEYEPATDLVLKVSPDKLNLFEGETAELNIKVKLGETNEYTVEVADESVCSFEDGVVTALKEGETTITVTTVDVNEAGEHLSVEVPVKVKGFKSVEGFVTAQVTDEHGTRFTKISLDGAVVSKKGVEAPGNVQSGGRGGNIYVADINGNPSVFDALTFEPTLDWNEIDMSMYPDYPAMDFANYPTYLTPAGVEVKDKVLMTLEVGWLVMPSYSGWNLSSFIPDLAAVAFAGLDEAEDGTLIYTYFLLGANGDLYYMGVDFSQGRRTDPQLVASTGIALASQNDASMTMLVTSKANGDGSMEYDQMGLVIADNGSKKLYYLDFLAEEEDDFVGLIGIMDVDNVSGLAGSYDELDSIADIQGFEPFDPGPEPEDPGEYPEPAEGFYEPLIGWDFEPSRALEGWTFFDRDADGNGWLWTPESDYSTLSAHEGVGMIISQSYINGEGGGALTPDNFAISPAIDLSEVENANFSFYAKGQDPSYASEVFAVYAGTTNVPGEMIKISPDFTATGSWTLYETSLADFAGEEEVYVAIRHYNVTDMYILDVDDAAVMVEGGEAPPEPVPPVYEWSFENATDLDGWTLLSNDGDSSTWTRYSATGVATDLNPGTSYVLSATYNGNAAVDDLAITPALDFSELSNAALSFWVMKNSTTWNENYSVYAGTSANFEEMEELVPETAAVNAWTNVTVDLADFVGEEEVYIAFRHTAPADQFRIYIDAIQITTVEEEEPTEPTEPITEPTEPITEPTEPTEPAEFPVLWDFEDEALDDEWTIVDVDGDSSFEITNTNNAYSGGRALFCYYGDHPDDWAISPAIDLTNAENPELSVYGRKYGGSSWYEYFQLYAGTSANKDEMTKVLDTTELAATYNEFVADLSEFAGEPEVYVAIRYCNSPDQFGVYFDDVSVREAEGTEPGFEPQPSPYYVVGDMNNWEAAEEYRLVTTETEGKFVIKNVLIDTDENLKILDAETNTWYPDNAPDCHVYDANTYDIEFYPAGGMGDDYFYGYFKLTPVNANGNNAYKQPGAGILNTYKAVEFNANKLGDGYGRLDVAKVEASAEIAKVGETANAVSGSTNAIRGELIREPIRLPVDETVVENGNVQIVLTEDKAVTNGLIEITYDANVLTFEGAVSELPYKSIHHEIVEETVEPTEPTEPTEPVTEPTEPVTEPTEPVTEPTEPTEPEVLADGFYLIGPDWNIDSIDANEKFETNPANESEYQLTTTLAEGDKVKVVKVESGAITDWYPDGLGNEYNVDAEHAGNVTIYFQETYKDDWSAFGGYFWIQPEGKGRAPEETEEPARKGVITIAYASADEIPAEEVLATLNFSYEGALIDTEVKVKTLERNDDLDVEEDDLIIPIKVEECEHVYGEPEWTWTEDLSAATAKFVCSKCGDEQVVEATVSFEEFAPSCTEAGKTVYTAKVTFNEAEYIDAKEVEGEPATGHTYGEPEWTWAEDFSSATAKFVCSKCGDEQILDAEITAECLEDKTVYTAKVTFNETEYTDVKEGPAAEVYELVDVLKDGEKIVIVNSAYNKALSNEVAANYYLAGKDVAPVDEKILNPAEDIVWTVEVGENGVSFVDANGNKVALVIEGRYTNLKTEGEDNVWILEAVEGADRTYFVKNATAKYNDKDQYLEWYDAKNYFSGYGMQADKADMYTFQFYAKAEGEEEHDCKIAHFTDVMEAYPFGTPEHEAIEWAFTADPQVTAGTSETTFGVGKAVKRGDAMFYLWVAAGKPEPTLTTSPFTDVTDPKAYYYKAVLWAYENGITKGVSDTEFGRKKSVSRRDMMVFLYTQQGKPTFTLSESPYTDVTDPKAYYYKAVLWAYEKGIDKGADGMFNGKSDCLRETVVLWMYRTLQGKALAE